MICYEVREYVKKDWDGKYSEWLRSKSSRKYRGDSSINKEAVKKALDFMDQFRNRKTEIMYMFLFDKNNDMKILKYGQGNNTRITKIYNIDDKECEGYVGVIIAHNHPNTVTTNGTGADMPSEGDDGSVFIYRRKFNEMELEYYDDLIIWSDGYYSYREHGYILEK